MTERTSTRRARRILLCAAGGYQCYALPGFILALLRHFADDVQAVLSRPAAKLVSKLAVEVASRHQVYVDIDETGPDVFVPHIELTHGVDLVLVYPATVNILGKVANGIADELIAALVLASAAPVIFVPVGNPAMLAHPAVRRNIKTLRDDGYVVSGPLPVIEVATREGLAQAADAFPYPELLAQMFAIVASGSGRGIPPRPTDPA